MTRDVLLLLMALASCAPAGAAGPHIVQDPGPCASWPRETKLVLPTEAADVVTWHDKQWARGRAAHDDCRDAYNKLRRERRNGS